MTIPTQDQKALLAHCEPFMRGEKRPATAAELMASRYAAYVLGNIDYLIETQDPKTRSDTDRKATEDWSKRADWRGLEIVRTEAGGEQDETGEVEFIAKYAMGGIEHTHHERATFRKADGRWYFVNGDKVSAPPARRAEAKIGRNDPCSCGSGKKYKKCHGA